MTEISFSGELRLSQYRLFDEYYCSNVKINGEWKLVCFWSDGDPLFLQIHRISTVQEILVSGAFKLMRGEQCVSKQTFEQCMAAGVAAMKIELQCKYNFIRHPPEDGMQYSYYSESDFYPPARRIIHAPALGRNSKFSINGTLKILAQTERASTHTECAQGAQFTSLLELSKDLECLLAPGATYFSDVIINCETVSLSAHKNILCARSSVFAAMFTTQMKESRNNKVDITDLSSHVFKTMMTFIYSGKTGELTVESAGELLFAADKYELQDLVRICSDYLKSCMSVESVLNTLVLGYLHDQSLKVFAIDFICNSCKEFEVLEKTVEWKNLQEKIPSLAMEVLTSLVKSKDKKLKRYQ